MFENIAAVKTNKPGKVKQPLNPYATSKRKQGYDHIERGLNINEEIYNTVYDNLKDVPSSEIINQLKYYDKQYDTSYETIFLLSELNRCAKEGDSLVVNATPDTIKYIALLPFLRFFVPMAFPSSLL